MLRLLLIALLIFTFSLKHTNCWSQTSTLSGKEFHKHHAIPKQGEVISRFGNRNGRPHTGTDIRLKKNDPVYAAFDGIVKKASKSSGYGKLIILQHSNGVETYYAHLNKILVRDGHKVKAGKCIGKGGQTGRATTEHLHFEIRINNTAINPEKVFDFEKGLYLTKTKKHIASKQHKQSKYYTVKKGDTLYSIAKKHATTIQKICRQNNIRKSHIIKVGQKLKL